MTSYKPSIRRITNSIAMFAFLFTALLAVVHTGQAQGTDRIQNYLSDTAVKVKAADSPAAKRAILGNSLSAMTQALDRIETSGLVSADDKQAVTRFQTAIQDKRDELAGTNGFSPVPDGQLNAFADYVVQDLQQAERTVTIGLVAALLIIIIVLLI